MEGLPVTRTQYAPAGEIERLFSPSQAELSSKIFSEYFPHSFEATRDARGAACHNQLTVGVEDLKRNRIGELVRVVTDLDNPRQPVCLRPGAGGTKNEGLGHRAVTVAVSVPPHTQVGSA